MEDKDIGTAVDIMLDFSYIVIISDCSRLGVYQQRLQNL